jgi:hypothetical protein
MEILWQNIFTQEAVDNESSLVIHDPKEKTWRIPVNVDDLTTKVQKLYGSVGSQDREVEYPQISWVREALEKFVSIGLAEKRQGDKEYTSALVLWFSQWYLVFMKHIWFRGALCLQKLMVF